MRDYRMNIMNITTSIEELTGLHACDEFLKWARQFADERGCIELAWGQSTQVRLLKSGAAYATWAAKKLGLLWDLSGADLSGADLIGADLIRANLSGADLIRAYLLGANLIGANLSRAYLRGANLCGANLRGANLCGANLRGANLSGADLIRANLNNAIGLP
jgi:uncharacterized protein YjbI with pentapeptide repeats